MKIRYLTFIILILPVKSYAQPEEMVLTLSDVLTIAQQKSLDAFKAINMYQAEYWEYQSFKAGQLPNIDLTINPSTYNRMMTQRYNYDNNVDVYREQQTLSSYYNLSVSQRIPLTGGRIYFDTDFSRLVNYGDNNLTTYSVTPARIGLVQPLFGFNSLKWEKKISPLQFEKAKQGYIHSVQETNLKAVTLYFDLILATKKKEIAQGNLMTADTLYKVGVKRFQIAAIQQDELLDLELSKFNAEINLARADKEVEKCRFSLNSFLGFDENIQILPQLPQLQDGLQISIDQAVSMAKKNNPEILQLEQNGLEAEKAVDQAVKESRFTANVSASYGLNQQAEVLADAYKKPLDQQMVMLSLDIPLLDWGERKGQKQIAQKNKDVVDIEVKQALTDFQQKVTLKAIDFNLQEKLVQSAAKADTIARNSYELTKMRFLLGNANILKLNNAINARQLATEEYINSLYNYWKYYYEIQQLTLFDFRKGVELEEDFDELLK